MVTAGVYMVARSHVIFERAPMALTVVAIVGTLTACFAATIGVTQTDIKKVWRTRRFRSWAYMFIACGVGAFRGDFPFADACVLQRAAVFGAGSVIHAVSGEPGHASEWAACVQNSVDILDYDDRHLCHCPASRFFRVFSKARFCGGLIKPVGCTGPIGLVYGVFSPPSICSACGL